MPVATHYKLTNGKPDMAIAIGFIKNKKFVVVSYAPLTALQVFTNLKQVTNVKKENDASDPAF